MSDHNLDINTITDITERQDIQTLQRQCPDFIPIFDYFETGELPTDDKAARKIILESEQFVIDNGILYHLLCPRTKRLDKMMPVIQQLCVPKVLREKLMIAYHDDQCHIGQEKLYNSLKTK